jgi:hypothetical protein
MSRCSPAILGARSLISLSLATMSRLAINKIRRKVDWQGGRILIYSRSGLGHCLCLSIPIQVDFLISAP